MHPRITQEFERICGSREIRGSVLEVGAAPSDGTLLCMKSMANASEKVGIDLDGPHEFRGFTIHRGNANSMDMFESDRFDVVICNATLEHDKYFWKTVSEIRRVTKPGGLNVIGIPAFRYTKAEKLKSVLGKIPGLRRLRSSENFNMLFTGTVTYELHNFPGDFYRFSEQAVREVLLEGMQEIEIHHLMLPPRIIGVGTKPRD